MGEELEDRHRRGGTASAGRQGSRVRSEPPDKEAEGFLEAGKAEVGHAAPQKPQPGCWKGSH